MERPALLQVRQKTHGDFGLNSAISQKIKNVFKRVHPHYENLSDVHKEALDMIALKLSRIMSGQPDFADHWDDVAGYAKLGSEACTDRDPA